MALQLAEALRIWDLDYHRSAAGSGPGRGGFGGIGRAVRQGRGILALCARGSSPLRASPRLERSEAQR